MKKFLCMILVMLLGAFAAPGAFADSCGAGYYYNANNECVVCQNNHYCTGDGTMQACPAGYTTNAGASAENQCYVTVTGGHYIGTAGQNSTNWETCAAGTARAEHTVNYGDTSSCTACPATTYNDTPGATSCTACALGYNYNTALGKTREAQCQILCPAGTYVKRVAPAANYAYDGLILHFDGYNNTRDGNNPNATTWHDLSPSQNDGRIFGNVSYDAEHYGYVFTADNSNFVETINNVGLSGAVVGTIEIVGTWYGVGNSRINGLFTFGSTAAVNGWSMTGSVNQFASVNASMRMTRTPATNTPFTMTYISSNGNVSGFSVKLNGEANGSANATTTLNVTATPIQIGHFWQYGQYSRAFNGIIHAVRVYNRVLTDNEIAQNHAMDMLRFADGSFDGNCVNVDAGYYAAASVVNLGSVGTRTACPSGYTSNAGASAENQCYVTVTGGHYIGTAGQNSTNWETCAAGTAMAEHTVNYGNTSSCTACTTDPVTGRPTYSTNAGAASCTVCPAATVYANRVNTYYYEYNRVHDSIYGCRARIAEQDATGDYLLSCAVWNGDYGVVASSPTSQACMAGNVTSCAAGYYAPYDNLSSNVKWAPTVAAMEGQVCVPVESGYYSADGALTRTACAAGLHTVGYGHGADEENDCGHILHVGNDVVYLRANRKTVPALNAKIGDNIFYGNMTTSDVPMHAGTARKLKVNYGGVAYSVYDDSVDVGE